MTDSTPSYRAILNKYNTCSKEVKEYFESLPGLVGDYPYEVSLAYLFLRTERAQNRALYGGVVKLHRAHREVAERAINSQHLTREGFLALFKNIFGYELPRGTQSKIQEAEKIRDKVIHGKKVFDADMRKAITDVLDYAEVMNKGMEKSGEFKPFGDMRGFKGRAEPLDKKTSRWLLKGLGFNIR